MSELPRTEDCNCSAVRKAARQLTRVYDAALAGTGLRTTQFSVLSRLGREGPMTINALAAALVMDRTTLSRNLMPLERDKLVAIVPSEEDRRSKAVHLTKEGRQRLVLAGKHWSRAQEDFEAAFGRKRSAELRSQLRAVVSSVDSAFGEASDDD